jgi:hypothetical protein
MLPNQGCQGKKIPHSFFFQITARYQDTKLKKKLILNIGVRLLQNLTMHVYNNLNVQKAYLAS